MVLPPQIIQMIRDASGIDLNTPKAFYALSVEISKATGEVLSENTLRRLLGTLDDDRNPHRHTLDVIGRYLGYPGWKELVLAIDPSDSSFMHGIEYVLPTKLVSGQKLTVKYEPDRELTMEYVGDSCFKILSSRNAKLLAGDIIETGALVLHYPLIAAKVLRNGENLGQYKAAEALGLASIVLFG